MKYIIAFDGGYNKSGGYGSFMISKGNDLVVLTSKPFPGVKTCNEAEYTALLESLHYLRQNCQPSCEDEITIQTDSQLVAGHMSGSMVVRADNLRKLYLRGVGLLAGLQWKINWWPREYSVQLFGH